MDKAHGLLPLWDPAALALAVRQGTGALRRRWPQLLGSPGGAAPAADEAEESAAADAASIGEGGDAAAVSATGSAADAAYASDTGAEASAAVASPAAAGAAAAEGGSATASGAQPAVPRERGPTRGTSAAPDEQPQRVRRPQARQHEQTHPPPPPTKPEESPLEASQPDAASAPATIGPGPAAAAAPSRAGAAAASPQLPAEGTAALGVLVMLHEAGWPNWMVWARWEELHEGRVVVLVHMKAGVEVDPAMPGAAAILERLLDTRVESRWGCLSLTEAILDCSCEVLARCPAVQHVAVCSGHDVPVARVPPGALRPGHTLFTDFRCVMRAPRASFA
ncbi:hypothetical protein MNEG_15415 [Monoraphidium neglectum]|uniref:Uncharacterized protein n=1 Tax=Monoraphidium neglectum TaxID=145388 RepID=A0A0D2K8W9_9CHLO|nr:hypothetical protein MNEG_15415 [Monoraphidium neglectum]KIY92548.1 hypothetical protein MNEG_15415 [Monoraphidium neglectum]|eukprot:XP_013891568.1 hypothetical protein MNEG_15415 [Monoraphidium neglectum]